MKNIFVCLINVFKREKIVKTFALLVVSALYSALNRHKQERNEKRR